ncbi:hypothetical protein Memar_2283 [Methanoculleus marisnigri JR1]|uniref:Uncharacterized protein n=1 Tax=Methanoculleus marisnigri (strain ATCC 35101 / DSM 1498 / JR1) TaxID=368407 RepID=A3CXV6_METMJ|nr:hypothetical protein Memar_2283 [Methanoculleus marisnigri JR1]
MDIVPVVLGLPSARQRMRCSLLPGKRSPKRSRYGTACHRDIQAVLQDAGPGLKMFLDAPGAKRMSCHVSDAFQALSRQLLSGGSIYFVKLIPGVT